MNVLEAERLRDLLAWLEDHHFETGYLSCFSDGKDEGPAFNIMVWLRPKEKKAKA